MKTSAIGKLDFLVEVDENQDLLNLQERVSQFITSIYELYGDDGIAYFAQTAHQELLLLNYIVENICRLADNSQNEILSVRKKLNSAPLVNLSKLMSYLENRLVYEL